MDERFFQSLIDLLIADSLAGKTEAELVTGLCERFVQAGVSLLRVSSTTERLHPTVGGQGVIWWRNYTVEHELHPRRATAEGKEVQRRSPFDYLIANRLFHRRWRFDDSYHAGEFPLLDSLKAKGASEYLALVVDVDRSASLSSARDVAFSWAADGPNGFTDAEIAAIERITPALTLVVNAARNVATGRVLLGTYLGTDAAERVLSGNFVRGQADPIRAAIWFSDLADFTRLSDRAPADTMLALLNDYAGALTDSIHTHDGQVLKFIGDGILAIFRDNDQSRACSRTLDAAGNALRKVEVLNNARHAEGLPKTEFKLALHYGDLLYGNFGSASRLDFTVLGSVVNEASRIAELCRSLDQSVIVSSAFAETAITRATELVSLGRYALKGVRRPQQLFTLNFGVT
jgi:adenylate cyclase